MLYISTDVSEEYIAYILRLEEVEPEWGSRFLLNVGAYLQNNVSADPKRQLGSQLYTALTVAYYV
jgi:hypothetical protein